MSTDLTLPAARSQRDALADRTEVLNKVGALRMVPGDTWVMTQMVADFYEVDIEAVRQIVLRNREELDEDGYRVVSRAEFESDIASLSNVDARARFIALFPTRAVMRVGMLLRDSPVAKSLRTALLDSEQGYTTAGTLSLADRLAIGISAYQEVVAERDATIATQAQQLEVAAPKVDYVDRYVARSDLTLLGVFAAEYGLVDHEIRQILFDRGLIWSKTHDRFSESKGEVEQFKQWRARKGPTFHWFGLKPEHSAPRLGGGALRQTLCVRQIHAVDLATFLGLTPIDGLSTTEAIDAETQLALDGAS